MAERAVRPLIVGEAPGPGGNPETPLAGRCGSRLARAAGLDDLDDAFDRANLLDYWPGATRDGSKFPLVEARAAAARLDLSDRPLVLLAGKRVAAAFRLGRLDYFQPAGRFVVVPHPSGANRWWNDPANAARATRYLRDLVARLPSGASGTICKQMPRERQPLQHSPLARDLRAGDRPRRRALHR